MGGGCEEKMAKNPRNRVKNFLLFSFVLLSVVLVAFQWVDGLRAEESPANPAFVRPTPANFQVDDDAYQNWNQLGETKSPGGPTPTPIP